VSLFVHRWILVSTTKLLSRQFGNHKNCISETIRCKFTCACACKGVDTCVSQCLVVCMCTCMCMCMCYACANNCACVCVHAFLVSVRVYAC